MCSSNRDRSLSVRPLVTLLLFVAAASLVITAGVAAEHDGGEGEGLEPADQIIVEGDQVVLVYEDEEGDEDVVEAEFGADSVNGLAYGSFQFQDDEELDFDGDFSSQLTDEEFTAEFEGTVDDQPEEVDDLSVDLDLVQSDSESRFDASASGVFQEQAPGEFESSGEMVLAHDSLELDSNFRADSILLNDDQEADISADISETSNGFRIDVDHTQQGGDLRMFETENATRLSLSSGADQVASQYGGTAEVSVNSHQFESGESTDRIELSYTIELQDVREGMASNAADQIATDEDLPPEQRDALERLFTEVEIETFTVDIEKTTDGVATIDLSMAMGGYNDALLGYFESIESTEEDFTAEDLETIEQSLRIQDRATLSQEFTWTFAVEPAGSGVAVSADAAYRTNNWDRFTSAASEVGLYEESPSVEARFAAEDTGETLEVDSNVRITEYGSLNQTLDQLATTLEADPETDEATVELVRAVNEAGLDVARFDFTFADQPQLEAGINFADRHGPMKVFGLAFADRHGPLKVDRHGPLKADRHGPLKADRHGPLRVTAGLTEGGATLNHFYTESDGDSATTFVYLGVSGVNEQQLRESPVADENTEILTPEDRQPQYLDVERAGEFLDVGVTDPSVRPPQLSVAAGDADDDVSLNLDEGTIDFGEQRAGDEVRAEFTVSNAGGGTLEVENPAFERSKNFITKPETTSLELGAGESETVSLVYAPEEAGEHTTAFTLQSNAPDSQPFTLNATGTATPPPELTVEPQSVNFDEVEVGETTSETVTIENEGEGDLDVAAVELRNDDVFTLRAADGGATDSFTVKPGDSKVFDIEFAPVNDDRSATSLLIRSNDPAQPNKVIYVSSGNVEATVEVDEQNRIQMNAKASNASPENPARIEMPDPVEKEDYETDSVSVTPAEETEEVSVNVTSSSKSLDTTPDDDDGFENGTEQVGNISVDANLENDQIQEVEFQTRIDTEKVEELESDAGNVSLYRYSEDSGEWVEKETEIVGQEAGETILRTTADGASEWTAAAKTPEFDITETNIDVTATTVDQEVTIQVLVTNTGGTDGSYEAELLLDDEVVDSQERTVPNGGTVGINFVRSFENPGLYTVQVNDVTVGEVNVSATEEEATVEEPNGTDEETDSSGESEDGNEDSAQMDEGTDDGETATEDGDEEPADGLGPGFGVTAALIAVFSAVLYLRRQ